MASKPGMRYGFENLRVYGISERLADTVWDIVQTWKPLAIDTVGKQLIRSADRIGADIAEGTGRSTPKDNRRFVDDARGSFYETRHWLRRAHTRKLLSPAQTQLLRDLVENLGPQLNSYRNALIRRSNLRPLASNLQPPTSS